jgi:hypothetical protein
LIQNVVNVAEKVKSYFLKEKSALPINAQLKREIILLASMAKEDHPAYLITEFS